MTALHHRRPEESDHIRVVEAIPVWWGMPPEAAPSRLLPRLFFQHFADTSILVEDDGGQLAAFLIGFRSASRPHTAYIHFVGVAPGLQRRGVARDLYERFFAMMRERGCTRVDAITGPINRPSQSFHRALGFALGGDTEIEGVLAYLDYDGPGEHRVTFSRSL
ncbi:GNAT family N-acetyltransferase [Micromonospora sp. DT81.3]|uniref:GNAT family N-acetyltransferase n=1 Tax=Micromonospora sp. DT81.3 TaxID=3416523 RepID=UPI003CFA655C